MRTVINHSKLQPAHHVLVPAARHIEGRNRNTLNHTHIIRKEWVKRRSPAGCIIVSDTRRHARHSFVSDFHLSAVIANPPGVPPELCNCCRWKTGTNVIIAFYCRLIERARFVDVWFAVSRLFHIILMVLHCWPMYIDIQQCSIINLNWYKNFYLCSFLDTERVLLE